MVNCKTMDQFLAHDNIFNSGYQSSLIFKLLLFLQPHVAGPVFPPATLSFFYYKEQYYEETKYSQRFEILAVALVEVNGQSVHERNKGKAWIGKGVMGDWLLPFLPAAAG